VSPPTRSARDRVAAARSRLERRAQVTDSDVVMAAAASFLAVRPRSTAETRRRLRHLGYPASLCDEVVERLVELGYLDDLAFAQAWVESRDRVRPRGSAALRRELLMKGVAREVIDEVLAERSAADHGTARAGGSTISLDRGSGTASADAVAARRLLDRRAASLRREQDPRRRRHKAYALLVRHGFSPDVCAEAAAAFVDVDWDLPAEGV